MSLNCPLPPVPTTLLPSVLCCGLFLSQLSDNSPEAWPASATSGGTAWPAGFARATELVAQMSLLEKVTLITGQDGRCEGNTGSVPRLGIPSLCLQDGPAGVRPVAGVSQFPAGVAVAATWNRDLMYRRGHAMGQEFIDQGINIALSPVTGGPLGRSPRGGRNWEGFAADAYLTGEASYQTVSGLQDAGVLATSKHWIGYEQETFRNANAFLESYSVFPVGQQDPISSNIDDKALHELYMWGFAESIRAGVSYVMCSYNEINRTHGCSNAYTQNNILKGELGFAGAIISDWGATWSEASTINGGLDVTMPGLAFGVAPPSWGERLVPLVENGTIAEERINDAAIRLLTPYFASSQATSPLPPILYSAGVGSQFPISTRDVRRPSTANLIRKIGGDSTILLKNERNTLPLGDNGHLRVAIIGEDAGDNALGPLDSGGPAGSQGGGMYPINNMNGTLSLGGGSGWAIPPYIVSAMEAVGRRAREGGALVWPMLNDTTYDAITTTASNADIALVFVSSFATEGHDRETLHLDRSGDSLIETAAAANNNTVVVIHAGGQVDVEAWFDHPNVTAVLFAPYPGQEAGNAIADVLFGDVVPSGRMPFTTSRKESDYAPDTIVTDTVRAPQAYFRESTLIDYRWFIARNIIPRFEFGFGLSYSTFAFSQLTIKEVNGPDHTSIQTTNEKSDGDGSLYDDILQVEANIRNTGSLTACEVAQLYITFPDQDAPYLRGFEKLCQLTPSENRAARFRLRRKDVSEWDVVRQMWVIPTGSITIAVGSSSTKIHLTAVWSRA